MASYKHATFAHSAGPRQGVYPLQQWEHYKTVKWRASQFTAPTEMYNYKERVEPAVILPGPPALPPRPLTKKSTSISSTAQRIRSRPDLHKTQEQQHCATKPPTGSDKHTANMEATSKFCVTAKSMSMQSRAPQKEKPSLSGSRIPVFKQPSFTYPDPTKVNGDPAFVERLAQLAQHEANTTKQEEQKRQSKKCFTRPSSAKSSTSTRHRKTSSSSVSSHTRSTRRCHSALSHRASVPSSMSSRGSSNDIHSHRNHRPMSARELKQTEPVKQCKLSDNTPSNDDSTGEEIAYVPPKVPREFLPETLTVLKECVKDSKFKVSLTESPGDDVLVESMSGSETEPAVVNDDLNVTSDLGLSIDSLHFSGEETSTELELGENDVTKDQSSSESKTLASKDASDTRETVMVITKSDKEIKKRSVASKGSRLRPPSSRTDRQTGLQYPMKPPTV